MRKDWYVRVGLFFAVSAIARPGAAQQRTERSHSSGLFIGLGVEGDGISTHLYQSSIWTKETGAGGGLVLGYGFTPRWSLYSQASSASINQDGGGTYTLRHLDAGARLHFRTGP